jgi:hypothetical protein
MTISVTVFCIGLVGITGLILSKYIEQRIGRMIFLPQWLKEREPMLEQTSRFLLKKGHWWMVNRLPVHIHRGWSAGVEGIKQIGMQEMLRLRGTLNKNGSTSMYLKRIIEHKHALRSDKK